MQVVSLRSEFSRGNPISGYPGSNDDDAFIVILPLDGIVLEHELAEETRGGAMLHLPQDRRRDLAAWRSRVSATGARGMMTLSGVAVMSTTEWPGKMYMLIDPEAGMAKDGGGGF